jgi:hypothetical protein
MSNRFDLEQGILNCWGITDDLNVLYRQVTDKGNTDPDFLANFILGLATVYNARFEELFETFEKSLKK